MEGRRLTTKSSMVPNCAVGYISDYLNDYYHGGVFPFTASVATPLVMTEPKQYQKQ